MQKSMLVVVDTDASFQRAVVRVGAAAGIEVVVCATARAAFNACGVLSPDCLVVAVSPADHQGFWLLAAIRARPEDTGAMPLVALASRDSGAHSATMTRIQALEAGADVVLQKPIETSELIAQVKALTKMAVRVRVRRGVLSDADGLGVLAGDLDLEPVSEVLRALEAKRWSGTLELGDRGFATRVLAIAIGDGALLGASIGDRRLTPIDALREALAWSGRRFELLPAAAPVENDGAASLAELLQSVLSTPGAGPLGGGRTEEDLPELSARLPSPPPTPKLDGAFASPPPAAIGSEPVTPSPGSVASRNQAPGRNLVESVRQSTRPDPRAESDS